MNTSKRSAVALLVASLSMFACDEQVVPTQQSKDSVPRLDVPADGRHIIARDAQTPPASAPGPYQHYTWINVTVDVGWLDAHTAYGQSMVQYGANNATADVNLSVRNASGAIIGANSSHASESWVFPGDHTLRTSTTVYVTPTCGSVAQGTASGTAFDTWLNTSQNMLKWGDQSGSDSKSSPQTACPPPSPLLPPTGTNPAPPSGPGYPGAYYPPPTGQVGHWECTTWNRGTPYETQSCIWYTGGYDRLPSLRMAPSRLAAPGAPLRAQGNAALPSVFVIVSDQVPSDAIAVIERHKTGPLKNVLLVPSSTIRPAVFVAAMQALYDSRDKEGDAPAKELSITLRGSILDRQFSSADRDYASAFTTQISSAKKGDAASYGILPIVEFKLGPKQ